MGRLLIATFGDSKPFGSRVNFYQTTRCYNPEDSNLHTHRRENLKSYCNEPSGSIKGGEFFYYLTDYSFSRRTLFSGVSIGVFNEIQA
jgi:hypothetical protein